MSGFYVEKWLGGRYGTVAWFKTYDEAAAEVSRVMMLGAWGGMPPRITTEKTSEEGTV